MVNDRSGRADPSSFYRLNEEIALELARLERDGALDRLLGLLGAAEVELLVSSARPREGLEELIGALRPRPAAQAATRVEAAEPPTRRSLGPAPAEVREGCGCSPPTERAADPPGTPTTGAPARPRGGWDHESFLAARSQFTLADPMGETREVYMPDHVCPSCWNDEDNQLRSCSRECVACGFSW